MPDIAIAPLRLTLPDGAVREVPPGTLPREVVLSIGERLLNAAVAVSVDGVVQDLRTPLRHGGAFRVHTDKDPESLPVLRHSAAHILATAVRRLRPDAHIGFGPAIDEGFYYDFEVATPFTPEDLAAFEAEMRKIMAEKLPFERAEVSREVAKTVFADDPLKLERIDDLGPDEIISTYTDGPFVDLCRGPHVPHTGWLKHVKLQSVAAAYWRGDSNRQSLQRIYGTAFWKKDELEQHLHRIEEAKKRDHRRLGKELDLFLFHPFSPGAAFWTERGTSMINSLHSYLREMQRDGYQEIKTPLLYNKALWEISGHWGKYKENMFLVLDNETGEHDISLKPMNCPSHHLMFAAKKHSYRELPLRYSTYDVLHRNELSGALSGLTRVRQFQQDDCHIYLMETQIADEVHRLVEMILGYYRTFGLTARLKFATRPEQRIGSDEMWDNAEAALRGALESTGLPFELKVGDGAFYGPKIDIDVKDAIGRSWQLSTIQADFQLPERFDLEYVGADNGRHRPIMLHRALFGSIERFFGVLLEHYAGAFPTWLAPTQVRVLAVAEAHEAYAATVVEALAGTGARVDTSPADDGLGKRIRNAKMDKIPYVLVVGDDDVAGNTVGVNPRGGEVERGVPVEDFVEQFLREIADAESAALGA